ncbi:MAG: ferrous iron transport protein A [Okeania sp. SIO3B3]|nr:ferrous iron transport protein A [Okeania sp. SIO3B3]
MLSNHPEKKFFEAENNPDLDSQTTTQLIDLSCLDIQKSAIIKIIEIDTYGEVLIKRLKAMGVVPEKQIMVLRKSCFGGPIHIRVGISTELAIRREEAKTIFVKPLIL